MRMEDVTQDVTRGLEHRAGSSIPRQRTCARPIPFGSPTVLQLLVISGPFSLAGPIPSGIFRPFPARSVTRPVTPRYRR